MRRRFLTRLLLFLSKSFRRLNYRILNIVIVCILHLLRLKRMLAKRLRTMNAIRLVSGTIIAHQFVSHRRYWSGFWDSFLLVLRYHRPKRFQQKTYAATDGEDYTIWSLNESAQNPIDYLHIWIGLPGGMEATDPAFSALISEGYLDGSDAIIFNNPGISTRMKAKPLPSPTDTAYLIEYIERLQMERTCKVSLIGFSIGCVLALRTLHDIQNNHELREKIQLESVVLIHGPDIVTEAIQHFKHNWFLRMDVYFALRIRLLQHWSGSWDMIKDRVNTNSHRCSVTDGWPFIEKVSVVSLGEDWEQCEKSMFNLRTFCDQSIKDADTRVYRIIAKNDWVVPYHRIDNEYFKYLDEVFVSDRGGHCGVIQCEQSISRIKRWNKHALAGATSNIV